MRYTFRNTSQYPVVHTRAAANCFFYNKPLIKEYLTETYYFCEGNIILNSIVIVIVRHVFQIKKAGCLCVFFPSRYSQVLINITICAAHRPAILCMHLCIPPCVCTFKTNHIVSFCGTKRFEIHRSLTWCFSCT